MEGDSFHRALHSVHSDLQKVKVSLGPVSGSSRQLQGWAAAGNHSQKILQQRKGRVRASQGGPSQTICTSVLRSRSGRR